MRTVYIHVYCSCLFAVKFSICSIVMLMVQASKELRLMRKARIWFMYMVRVRP